MVNRLHPMTRSEDDRRALIPWVTECALRVLPLFEVENPNDGRPRAAIEGARAWMEGEIGIGAARSLAFGAHAAAREASQPAAVAAARSAGHAAAVAHMAGHARSSVDYALKATGAMNLDDEDSVEQESRWQRSQVPRHLRDFVYPTA